LDPKTEGESFVERWQIRKKSFTTRVGPRKRSGQATILTKNWKRLRNHGP